MKTPDRAYKNWPNYDDDVANKIYVDLKVAEGDSSGDIKFLKVLYSTTKGHLQDEFILKKLLHSSAGKVATDLNLNLITITPSGEIITISDPTLNEIPQTIVLKEKARKIMFFKMFVESKELACEFDRFYIEFRMSGKYRGE